MNAKAQKEKSVEKPARQSRRVLLITNDSDDPLRSSLESTGLEIVGVCAGAAALVSLQRSRPQLVIASIATKGISTLELARMLGQSQDGTPLILVGAEAATRERRQAALSAGAFDYYQIPAEFELLALRARQLIKVRQTMERLRGEADLDHLTGLANRRRFRVALTGEVERWRRYGVPCALLLLDIDHMKAINDNFGHPVGDVVIREIASTLTRVSRDNDTAARLGGEEFALLFAGIDGIKAEFAAKRLLDTLAEQQVEGVGSISVSIGVASCPDHADSERTLYTASDRALYVAKNEGRKRVAVAPLMQERVKSV
ncbi:MAG TPA: diguanylate cyclase [Pyrinomonadaceae bacterium]|nr:diguanylate cyclase [Pyrinomonadaceae bacterium]